MRDFFGNCNNTLNLKPNKVIYKISIDYRLEHNDNFKVYYENDLSLPFSENKSYKYPVTGSFKTKVLEQDIVSNRPIEKLRIDLGSNKKNTLIELKKITIKKETKQITIHQVK